MRRGTLAMATCGLILGVGATPARADVVPEQLGVEYFRLQGDGEGDVIVLADSLGKIVYSVNGTYSDDWVPGVPGSQTVSDNGTVMIVLAAGGGDDTVIGLGFAPETLEISGEGGDDMLLSGPVSSLIEGGAGDDFIGPGPGSDAANGDGGDDVLRTGYGDDTDVLEGGAGSDRVVITGDTTGPDTISALAEGDFALIDWPVLLGTQQVRIAGAEAIAVRGSGGDDTIEVASSLPGRPALTLDGGPDGDTLSGGAFGETLLGGDGDDDLSGAGGPGDRLDGGKDRDSFNGGSGKGDICDGGPDRDLRPALGCETVKSIP